MRKKQKIKSKNFITFLDYHSEWLIPPLIARQNGEGLPILICHIPKNNDYYVWYHPFLERLNLIDQCEGRYHHYHFYEVNDLDAYQAVFCRIHYNHSIVSCVVCEDCDREYLKRFYRDDEIIADNAMCECASWSYWQQYGGGADEHYGNYYEIYRQCQILFGRGANTEISRCFIL